VSDTPGSQLEEEPQEERGAPGSRDTGSDEPGGGPVDRPAGTADDDEDNAVNPSGDELGGPGELPPADTGNVVPPYEGRRESADVDTEGGSAERDAAKVGGASGPVEDSENKAPEPADTPGGAVASPADEQPAQAQPEDEPSDPGVGPRHSSGVRRAEDQ
jgi:hypothetical protein